MHAADAHQIRTENTITKFCLLLKMLRVHTSYIRKTTWRDAAEQGF